MQIDTPRDVIARMQDMYADDLDQPIIVTWWDFEFAQFFLKHDSLTLDQQKAIWAKVCSSEWIMDEISDFQYETIAEAINKEII